MAEKMNEPKLAMSIEETARALSVCSKTVHNLIRRGDLRARKVGARTVILTSDLEEFLKTRPLVATR